MRLSVKLFIYISVIGLLAACSSGSVRNIPIEDFFKNPEKTSFKISPDGQYISYLQPFRNRLNIYIQPINGDRAIRITSGFDRNVSYYFWANNEELLYLKDNDGDENLRLYAVNRDGSNVRELIPDKKIRIRIISLDRIHNDQLLLGLNKRDSSIFDAYRLNLKTGKLSMVAQNPGNITNWIADAEGQLRLAVSSDGVSETILYRGSENERYKPLFTNNFKTSVRPIGFCAEKDRIYALSNQGRDKMALVVINCLSGKEERVIYSHPDVDVSEGDYSYLKRRVLFAEYNTWKNQRHFLDEPTRQLFENFNKLLPHTEVRIADRSLAEDKFIIRTYTDRTPGAFYLYQTANGQLNKLSEINSAIKEDELCEMKPISYQAADGVTIQGYLTLPRGKNEKNLPVVVLPHGGPDNRNNWSYNAEVQFLANRGYAVFQVNFRGSKGYGKAFWSAGFKQWGGKIQQDISDGVHWLIKEGIADPKHIGIFGFSFGGYSALWGLCYQPDLYACGVSYSGLSNLYSYLKAIPPYYKPYRLMYEEMVGNPQTDAEYFRKASPVFHTDKIESPLLIAQGARDSRVSILETNQLVKELRKRNVEVTYLVKENEGHVFRNEENRLDFYRHLEKFFEKNLKEK
ncbi:MAG: S9 family peptidase [Sphingobacteriaceae bacterium]